ncbi:FAD:protein FMN transferase [Elioraea sp.]|uniref:FAD:protein FMN transferase n=1 Tax=Elioraea sp. TaxID=2185103 RepID=UPI00307EB64E
MKARTPAGVAPGRRRTLAALPLCVLAPATLAASAAPEVLREARPLMGTRVGIIVQAPGRGEEARPAVAAAFGEMQRLEAMMTRYAAGNALKRLEQHAGGAPQRLPRELFAVLQAAAAAALASEGAFDITVGAYSGWHFEAGAKRRIPAAAELAAQRALVGHRDLELDAREGLARLRRQGMRLDLGGIAKLPILEAGHAVLARHGLADALIDGGGDIRASGRLQGRAWRVGLRDPLEPARLLGTVEIDATGGWVASSGDYERMFVADGRRYHHILDPKTGEPTRGPRGVSLLGRELGELNGLGVALMVGGRDAAERWLSARPGVQALLVQPDGSRWSTPGFDSRLRRG